MLRSPLHAWIAHKTGIPEASFDAGALAEYQLARFKTVFASVRARSPFYRNLCASIGEDFPRSLEDMRRLPFTSADDLRRSPAHFVCVPQGEVQRIVTLPTSGTSGEPKRLYFSAEDLELTVDFFRVGMSSLCGAGDRVLILFPVRRPDSIGQLLAQGLERLGCTPVLYGPFEDEETVLRIMKERDVNVAAGAPVQLNRLAVRDAHTRILAPGQVRALLLSSDVLASSLRAALERTWGCEVFDHWGMTETGLGGGVECAAHAGMHLREADLFVEIVDPTTGESLPEGTTGEVVITTLTRTAMPLIRYRTGDLSRIISAPCACGTWLPRLDSVRARLDGGVTLGGNMLCQIELDETLFGLPGLLDFQAFMGGESLRVDVRLTPQGSPESVRYALKQMSALEGLDVRVEVVGEIRSAGKRQILH